MYIITFIICYLIGNLTGGYILSKLVYGEDIRNSGSGNAGTTNALRTYGKKIGILTLVIDFGKGILALIIARYLQGDIGVMLGSVAVVIGHDFPVFLNFKGGKGIATSAGVISFIEPKLFLLLVIVFFALVILTKYVSLASILGALTVVLYGLILCQNEFRKMVVFAILGLLAIIRHKENIKRLLTGSERKLSLGGK